MFSPDAAGLASVSARNPRRRQRNGSEDSIAIHHNPKRIRRSILTPQIFEPPEESVNQNGHLKLDAEQPLTNGYVREPGSQRHASGDATSLAIRHRGVKKADRERRSGKHDGSFELTRNENYVVTRLPTTPEILQDFHTSGITAPLLCPVIRVLTYIKGRWHGEVSPHIGYSLATTQTQAIIWRYVQGSSAAEHLKPVNIKILHPSKNPRDPLPLGILVPTATEPGILLVAPSSGKLTYWESLSSAASSDASRQKQQSVQGVIPGLMSAESVTKITEAEPRGFVLSMSTGRLAHLIIGDSQGQPSISIHFLRDNGASSGGVFRSLRTVFSTAGWKKDIAAVRSGGSSHRGQRYVVAATTTGVFQTWELNWNGTHSLVGNVDAKANLLKALLEPSQKLDDSDEQRFEVLDFTLLHQGAAVKAIDAALKNGDCRLMTLTVLKSKEFSSYALVGLMIANGCATIDVVHPITCYKSPIPAATEFRPQVIIPESAQTAFVILERTLVLVSLAEVDESPSSQLQIEAHTLPDPFQDAVDFRTPRPYRVVGCASERSGHSHGQPSCVVMIYGFGIIRVAALPLKEGQSVLERATVTAKTKFEQAVFFGGPQQDLLDFDPRPENQFSPIEIEAAALSISQSIMDSTSAYIPAIGPSMDQQLQRRSVALSDLNKHLRKHYPNALSRLTKWKLLWDAEKLAAAKAIWHCYNVAISDPCESINGKNLLTELIEAMSEKIKNENQPDRYETDGVRHWFINDLWRLQHILPWAQFMVELLLQEAVEDAKKLDLATQARLVSEANDIQLAALETAFKFREANADTYGLGNEAMTDGVLQRGFEELPEFWTSMASAVERVKTLTDVSRELTTLSERAEDEDGAPSPELIVKLAADNPRQVQICCQTYIERFRWLKSRQDPESRADGEKLQEAHFKVRKILFASLSDVGQPDVGIQLAEKYRDMEALVEIIDQELEAADSDDVVQMYEERIISYFTKFGTAWADAYLKKHLAGGNAVNVLNNNAHFKAQLTNFLRRHPPYAKLSWINEVASESNYLASSDHLKLAEKREAALWSKKIRLSMSKLSLMAAKSKGQITDHSAKPNLRMIDERMAIFTIQEQLYHHIKPIVHQAVDIIAQISMVMETYGAKFVDKKPVFKKALERHLEKFLAMEALSCDILIDLLTLLDHSDVDADEEGVMDLRFFSAFRVLRLSNLEATDPGYKNILERVIWRRCIIQDDWEDVNRTELKAETQVEKETGATSLFKTLREGYRTGFWDRQAPLPPSSLADAGTTIESLKTSSHFSNMPDNALVLLARDLEREAESLDQCIEKGRLDEWWKGVVDAAKEAARQEANEKGEEMLRKRQAELDFDRLLAEINEKECRKAGGGREVGGQGNVVMES